MTDVFFFLILVGGILLMVMIFRSQSGEGSFKFGNAGFSLSFKNWEEVPGQGPVTKQKRSAKQEAGIPRARYYLEARGPKGKLWRYPLTGTQHVYIGRRADSQVRLLDRSADSRQAVIYVEDGRFKINNLSSRKPTLVNNKRFGKQNLGDGNTITAGRTKLIFRDGQLR